VYLLEHPLALQGSCDLAYTVSACASNLEVSHLDIIMDPAVVQLAKDRVFITELDNAIKRPDTGRHERALKRWITELGPAVHDPLADAPFDTVAEAPRRSTPLVNTLLPFVPELESAQGVHRGRGRSFASPEYSRKVKLARQPMGDVEEIFYDLKTLSVDTRPGRGATMSKIMQDIQSELDEYT